MATKAQIAANQLYAPVVPVPLWTASVLNVTPGALNTFINNWPKGPGIYETDLHLQLTLTVGTATGPITDGILNYIKQITFKGDTKDTFVNQLSARAIVMGPSFIKSGGITNFDQIAAASGVYDVWIKIYHWDPLEVRPEDTFLDTRLYDQLKLTISLGSMADLFTTPGTASVTATCDIQAWMSYDDMPANVRTIGFTSYGTPGPQDVTQRQYIQLVRDDSVLYKRIYLQTASAGGGTWYGPNSDSIISQLFMTTTADTFLNGVPWENLQQLSQERYKLAAVMAGRNVIDLTYARSNRSALYSDRNNLRVAWTNAAGVVAGDTASIVTESYNKYSVAA